MASVCVRVLVDGQRVRLRNCCVADGQFDLSASRALLRMAG
jgi:hypothetical protein